MDKKDINYNSILYLFEGNEDCQISALIQEIAGSINDLELDKIDPDEAFDLTQHQQGVAFALGFTFGKMFDLSKSETEAIQVVEQIKKIIRESGILRYLPVQRKDKVCRREKGKIRKLTTPTMQGPNG
jgi:hypothetical protein